MIDRITPKKYRELANKALNTKSRKAAIRAFCLECCGWLAMEVRLCSDKDCFLYKFRLKG